MVGYNRDTAVFQKLIFKPCKLVNLVLFHFVILCLHSVELFAVGGLYILNLLFARQPCVFFVQTLVFVNTLFCLCVFKYGNLFRKLGHIRFSVLCCPRVTHILNFVIKGDSRVLNRLSEFFKFIIKLILPRLVNFHSCFIGITQSRLPLIRRQIHIVRILDFTVKPRLPIFQCRLVTRAVKAPAVHFRLPLIKVRVIAPLIHLIRIRTHNLFVIALYLFEIRLIIDYALCEIFVCALFFAVECRYIIFR